LFDEPIDGVSNIFSNYSAGGLVMPSKMNIGPKSHTMVHNYFTGFLVTAMHTR
jgi:hypothetical protein